MRLLGWVLLIGIGAVVVSLMLVGLAIVVRGTPSSLSDESGGPAPIPRSMSDPCAYFLVEVSRDADVLNVVTRQDCPTFGRSFERMEANCATGQFRYLGDGRSISLISHDPSGWTPLVRGSAKSDIVGFVCAKDALGEHLPTAKPPRPRPKPNRRADEAKFLLLRVADAARSPCSRTYDDLYFRGRSTSWTVFSDRHPGHAFLGPSSKEFAAELELMRQRTGSSKISWRSFAAWSGLCR